MSISIAGRAVQLNDPLYHTGIKAWGTVVRFDTGAAVLRITGAGGQRDIYVQANGYVNGVRQVFWHEPLWLDLPVQNVGKYQRILNALLGEFNP